MELTVISLEFLFWGERRGTFIWGEHSQGIANTWDQMNVASQTLPKQFAHVEAAVRNTGKVDENATKLITYLKIES